MQSRVYIALSPGKLADIGIGVIVQARTGVVYNQQCGGELCRTMEIEGFFVPVGHPVRNMYAERLVMFFKRYGCSGEFVTGSDLDELRTIVERIPFWWTERFSTSTNGTAIDRDRTSYLKLDDARLDEVMEAWVPVITHYGPGVLTFENCD